MKGNEARDRSLALLVGGRRDDERNKVLVVLGAEKQGQEKSCNEQDSGRYATELSHWFDKKWSSWPFANGLVLEI